MFQQLTHAYLKTPLLKMITHQIYSTIQIRDLTPIQVHPKTTITLQFNKMNQLLNKVFHAEVTPDPKFSDWNRI